MTPRETLRQISDDYEQSAVDDELNALPEKYRLPIFLCCVEGKSLEVTAKQLGWSLGSVKGRLERGRQELRRRLMLRRTGAGLGVALAAITPQTATATTFPEFTASGFADAPVPTALFESTVQAAMQYAAGRSTLGYVTQHALSLADGSFQLMSASTMKFAACTAFALGVIAWGGSQIPAPAKAGGSGPTNTIELHAGIEVGEAPIAATLVALAGDGDAPRGAREGDKPREGAREGDQPRSANRESAGREGAREGARESGSREGAGREGTAREGMRGMQQDPLAGFRPANQREAVLLQMIMALRNEVAQLRAQVQNQGGEGMRRGVGDGDRANKGPRDGEAGAKGPRDGERKGVRGPKDGEEGAKKGPGDGDAGAQKGPRDGES